MDIVILDGRRSDQDFCSPQYAAMAAGFHAQAAQVTEFALRTMDIRPCLGCFNCWVRTPGECIQVHGGQQVAQAYIQADLGVFFTPVTFGGYSSELKKAVDHLIPNISPFFAQINGETHHHRRYPQYPSLLVVGVLPQADERQAAIFRQLAERNRRNFFPPHMACEVLVAGEPWMPPAGLLQVFCTPQEGMA